jgi:hypothetical protein
MQRREEKTKSFIELKLSVNHRTYRDAEFPKELCCFREDHHPQQVTFCEYSTDRKCSQLAPMQHIVTLEAQVVSKSDGRIKIQVVSYSLRSKLLIVLVFLHS